MHYLVALPITPYHTLFLKKGFSEKVNVSLKPWSSSSSSVSSCTSCRCCSTSASFSVMVSAVCGRGNRRAQRGCRGRIKAVPCGFRSSIRGESTLASFSVMVSAVCNQVGSGRV